MASTSKAGTGIRLLRRPSDNHLDKMADRSTPAPPGAIKSGRTSAGTDVPADTVSAAGRAVRNSPDLAVRENLLRARIQIEWGNGRLETLRNFIEDQGDAAPDVRELSTPVISERAHEEPTEIYVVTPVLNGSEYIDSTIISVLSQEGQFRIRYHVKDGGSTDGTPERLRWWERHLSNEPDLGFVRCLGVTFSYECGKDNGLYDAIDRGFKYLKPKPGSICTWINADDVFTGGAFASAVKVFEANRDCHWIIGTVNACGNDQEELTLLELQFPREIISAGLCDHVHWPFIQQEGSFWSVELWNATGGVDPSFKLAGDWDVWRRFARVADPVHVMWPLGRFRVRSSQLSVTSMAVYVEEMNRTVPRRERDRRLGRVLARPLTPVRMVFRANRRTGDFKCRNVEVAEPYVRPGPGNKSALDDYFWTMGKRQIRVLTLATLAEGGAGTRSLGTVEALRQAGIDARILSIVSRRREDYVGRVLPTLDAMDCSNQGAVWEYLYHHACGVITGSEDFKGHELFSNTFSILDFRQLKSLIEQYDILHFHWVVGMLGYAHLGEVVGSKPIVWTMTDMNPFTGGCLYSQGCEGYKVQCGSCPLVPAHPELARHNWNLKKSAYENLNITVVCPSQNGASRVRESSLFRDRRVVVIPNAYPIDRFKPMDRVEARTALGLPLDKRLVMFTAQSIHNERKGGDLLVAAARLLKATRYGSEIQIIRAGKGSVDLPVTTHHLGELDEEGMSRAYSAADVFISLSREDNGPTTVVESLLCGTPVVGFDVGILSEVVIWNRTGICVPVGDLEKLVSAVERFLEKRDGDSGIRTACRDSAMRYGDPRVCAVRHKQLYEQILNRS